MTETELHWLAGWLEGEGTFIVTSGLGGNGKRYPRIRVNATSTDHDVLVYVKSIAGGHVNGPYESSGVGKKPVYTWTLSTHTTAVPLMEKLLPLMVSERRKQQVQRALDAAITYLALKPGTKGDSL